MSYYKYAGIFFAGIIMLDIIGLNVGFKFQLLKLLKFFNIF